MTIISQLQNFVSLMILTGTYGEIDSTAINGCATNGALLIANRFRAFDYKSLSGKTGKRNGKPLQAECAQILLPLCHESICPSNITGTTTMIPIFLKRYLGKRKTHGIPRALWLLQGGPGASSAALEEAMISFYEIMNFEVDVYTMDHRGTGRSRKLSCDAAEAETLGSPGGSEITPKELLACAQDIAYQIDNRFEAFSITSAAIDLSILIARLHLEVPHPQDVYVYGVSYGTLLVERYLQIAPQQSRGVILDSVVAQQGSVLEVLSLSSWDLDMNSVGIEFLRRCKDDKFCASKIGADPANELKNLYRKVDDGHCAAFFHGVLAPSKILKLALSTLLMDYDSRLLIPVIIYRMRRCRDDDVVLLKRLFATLNPEQTDEVLYDSEMLYNVIVAAEIWENPTPTNSTLTKLFDDGLFGTEAQEFLPAYCVLSAEDSPACAEIRTVYQLPVSSRRFTYDRDKYFNKTADLRKYNISILMLSGELDPQTPLRYAELQYNNTQGKKKLVQFANSTHGTIYNTPLASQGDTCAELIIASFMSKDGNLDEMDTSCVKDILPLVFNSEGSIEYMDELGVSDYYDGVYNDSSITKSIERRNAIASTTAVAVIVGLGTALLFALIALFLLARRLQASIPQLQSKMQSLQL